LALIKERDAALAEKNKIAQEKEASNAGIKNELASYKSKFTDAEK